MTASSSSLSLVAANGNGTTNSHHEVVGTTATPLSPLINAASPYWNAIVHAQRKETNNETGFSPFVAFCFTINYILGTGFLTIPWAFVQGGLVLSTISLLVSAIVADMSKDYLLETMARAETMLDEQMNWKKRKQTTRKNHQTGLGGIEEGMLLLSPVEKVGNKSGKQDYGSTAISSKNATSTTTKTTIVLQNSAGGGISCSSLPGTPDLHAPRRHLVEVNTPPSKTTTMTFPSTTTRYLVKERKFEVNVLCRVFLGKAGVRIFTLFICLYMWGLLWAYTSVFSSAMAKAAPLFGVYSDSTNDDDDDDDGDRDSEDFNYLCYAFLFGIVVVPLSCMELDEQVAIQVTLTGCRFFMLILMLGTSATCADEMQEDDNFAESSDYTQGTLSSLFRPSGLYKMLPIVVVANMYHHSIPGLSHPVADKKQLGSIFQYTSIFTAITYAVLGVMLGSRFGEKVEQASNLNWKGYHGGTGIIDENGELTGVAWWAKAISFYILVFPALDVISAFPLNAITVGNNMFGAFYGKRIVEVDKSRWRRTCFRLLASVPPIILGIFVRELGLITDYTGITGFVIGLSIPAILFIESAKAAKQKSYSLLTHYTSYGSSAPVARVLFWIGIFMVICVFVSLTFLP